MTARNEIPTIDKLDIHHRQQLSALMDGELVADEARFLLRRLQHDQDLAGCWERWQLCGDVLRGQGRAPAPTGFAERVAKAVAAESVAAPAAAHAATGRPRNLLARWGGGALAASVALVALFMARQQGPQPAPAGEDTQVASAQAAPTVAPAQNPAAPAPDAEAYAAAAVVAAASLPRRQDNATRRSATRNQQAARSAQRVARAEAPVRATGTLPVTGGATNALATAPLHASTNPFSHPSQDASAVPARPWPRSALSAYPSATGALTTGYSSESAGRTFYPFEPRPQQTPPVELPTDAPRE
ncbi:anti sigma-E protein, RseA [Pseudoxanthomonas sp. CF385]|uniref:sigma-E factor negative regulatory protein n=1 Tax=Pseudoxanthomonas sp. CF385 TaxID=1881042 RepID=UPI000888E929|nr:sigma-E factor negative regulatory protein [Pseudoxanthomonas sp. CF385]SDQ56384.1 anti sigma-E protein, RseA [Pseudoxanthomonas sp. CF385]